MVYDTGYHYRHSFFWRGYTYKLQISNPGDEHILLKFQGTLHDQYTSIINAIIGEEEILNFLIMEDVPMNQYLEVEKVFMERIS